MENTGLYALAAIAIVVLAAAAAWVETRVERREEPKHRQVLKREQHYRREGSVRRR